jgi:hypothetical protein
VRELARLGILEDQEHAHLLTWTLAGRRRGRAWAWFDGVSLVLMYGTHDNETGEDRDHERSVQVEWLPASFGGRRPWFRCPACHRRCAVLYVWGDTACRRCHGFAYESQRQSADEVIRTGQEFRTGRELLDSVMVPGQRFVKRPGVRWVKYYRTIAKAIGLMESAIARLERRRRR